METDLPIAKKDPKKISLAKFYHLIRPDSTIMRKPWMEMSIKRRVNHDGD